MNRNDVPPRIPTLVADASSASPGPQNGGDSPVDHDPTLKWIISDLAEAEEKTPPPLRIAANERTPPLQPAPLPRIPPSHEPAAGIRTPPPLATGQPAEEKTPRPNAAAMARTPPPEAKPASRPITGGKSASGPASLVATIHGATPAEFFAADSTPPPPSPPGEKIGAAPVGVSSDISGSDSELSADAVELVPSATEESGSALRSIAAEATTQAPPASSPTEPAHDDTPRDGVHLDQAVSVPASESPTEPREVEPDAIEMLESAPPEAPAEPREVEPEAVEMLESAEHQTEPGIGSETAASSAQTPPPVPTVPSVASESSATAIPPTRPTIIAAALFDEYQTPASGADPIPEALARRSLKKRAKPWYEEVFDEDFLRTLPFMTPEQTAREVKFIREALSTPAGGEVLDVGCGYGRHALELAQQGLRLTGLDLSLPMLIRAADHAQKRGLAVNFVHADMREMTYNGQFDSAYCMLSSFGYFDEETNLRVATAICRALKPGGRFLLDIINRDYIVGDLPSRVWWEGDGCVVLEEVDFNYHTSRVLIRRSVVFGNGRQSEQEISLRAYSLHEVGKLLRQAGLRVLDVSGGLATKSKFYGAASRNILAVCERPAL